MIRDAKPLELSHDEKVEEKESKDDGGEPETDQGDKTGPVEVKTPEPQERSTEAEKKERDSSEEK